MQKTALLLKVVGPDMRTRNGFLWPREGPVECPDWDPKAECGNGLHAWRWTATCDLACSDYTDAPDSVWLAVQVNEADIVDLKDKCKFRKGIVVFAGTFEQTVKRIQKDPSIAGPRGIATAGDWGTATAGYGGTATAGYGGTATAGPRGTATAGDWGTATAGPRGTATAGDWGTATAGPRGTATAGDWGTATAGPRGTATAGDGGTATAGPRGTATAGYGGTATAGDWGTATAGPRGTATAGDWGTATAGDGGTATAGPRGIAMAGDGGLLVFNWQSEMGNWRKSFAPVDGETIKPGVPYRCENGQCVEAPLKEEAQNAENDE